MKQNPTPSLFIARPLRFSVACAFLVTALSVRAAHTVADFEEENSVNAWTVSDGDRATISSSGAFASSGARSAKITFARRERGEPKRAYVEWTFPAADWKPYHRIAFDVVNPTSHDIQPRLYISDDASEIQNGLRHRFGVAKRSAQRIVKDLNYRTANDKSIYAGDITTLRLVVEDAPADLELHLDNIVLLGKDEEYPGELPDTIRKQVWDMQKEIIAENMHAAGKRLEEVELPAALKKAVRDEAVELQNAVRGLDRKGEVGPEQLRTRMVWQSQYLSPMIDRFLGYVEDMEAYKDLGIPDAGFYVGFAPPTHKVMPRHLPLDLKVTDKVDMSAARGEEESIQLAVVPTARSLRNVRVAATSLRGDEPGVRIPADRIDCDLVAFTETKNEPGYDVDYIGWWPDPLIPNPRPVSVALGEAQTWWIRVNVPEGQKPGAYSGEIRVDAGSGPPLRFELNLRVYDFGVPRHAPMPLAITTIGKKGDFVENLYGKENWHKEAKFQYADYLADYYLMPDCLYRHPVEDLQGALDMELIEYMRKKGTLGPFSLGYFHTTKPEWLAEYRANYEAVKEAGLVEYAYFYGWDECPTSYWEMIEESAQVLKKSYPGVYRFTTTREKIPAQMPSMSATCPINAGWDGESAEVLREEYGIDSWWYTCVWPPHPYPNFFLEYDPIDARVMMGIQHAKYKPDGFLFYETTIYNDNEEKGGGIKKYPYTGWNPVAFGDTHGDGRWLYFMANGRMIPSMVMENFRDGLEDLAYYMILAYKVKLYKEGDGEAIPWLKESEHALTDFDSYSKYRNQYTKSAEKVYEFRNRLARLIEASPIRDDNPWAGHEGMPVRGVVWDRIR